MTRLERELYRLSARLERLGGSDGPTRAEVQEATQRLNAYTRRYMNAALFGLPMPTEVEEAQARQDAAIVRAWSQRSGAGLEHPNPDLLTRLDRRIEQQVELGEPWPAG